MLISEKEKMKMDKLIETNTLAGIVSAGAYPIEVWKEILVGRITSGVANRWMLG